MSIPISKPLLAANYTNGRESKSRNIITNRILFELQCESSKPLQRRPGQGL